jgi:excisionase family DNA binding protein
MDGNYRRLGTVSRERALRDIHWVVEFLGMSNSWVYQAVESGILPCIRIGSALRFDKADIESWLKNQRKASQVSSGEGR